MLEQVHSHMRGKLPKGFPQFFGGRHLSTTSKPPRVVWVPAVENFGPADLKVRDGEGRPLKALRTRLSTVIVYFWERDFARAEALLHDYINLLYHFASTSFSLGEGSWLKDDAGEWLNFGEAYALPVTFDIPVIKSERFAMLESIAQECASDIYADYMEVS